MKLSELPSVISHNDYFRWIVTLTSSTVLLIFILYQQDEPLHKLPVTNKVSPPKPNISSSNEFQLIDVSLDWHLNFVHQQRAKGVSAITDTLGAGVCAIDYNNDGWTDLYFVGGSGNTRRYGRASWWHKTTGGRLFENRQGQYLKDVTESAGLNFTISGMGCAVDDINADGFNDILITGIDANRLFKNNGDGSFSDVTVTSSISSLGWSTGAVFGDFNNDGLPDLYIAKFIKFKKDATTFEENSGFQSYDSAAFDPSLYDAEANQLYLNKGGFLFEDVTEKFNVANQNGRSLGARWIDLNNDTWLDLIVINQHPSPNEVYINRYSQEFIVAKDTFNVLKGTGNHDFIDADFNNDGHTGFFLTRGSQLPIQLFQFQNIEISGNQSRFKDVSHTFGLTDTKLTPLTHWGAVSGDFDNDGYKDVFIANGKAIPDPDSHFVALSQPNTLLMNKSGKRFSIAKNNDIALINNSSRAAITTDLNNDGRLEIVVTNNNGSIQILKPEPFKDENKKTSHWIGFELINAHSVNEKTGTIEIEHKRIRQTRNLLPSTGFLSQSEKRFHFGLSDSKQIDRVTIKIPKTTFTIKNLAADHYYAIDLLTGKTERLTYSRKVNPLEPLAKVIDTDALSYLAKILLKNNIPEQFRALSVIWHRSDSEHRLVMLKSFTQIENLFGLKLTILALSDPRPEVVITAINILKNSEIEETMDALISQLYVSNTDIQCAAANTLAFFFREEEAVIFQKNLALKHLIRILENDDEQIQICAAKALGASESKRAVVPLLKLISPSTQSKNSLKTAAINALSEIRDSQVISHLSALIGSQNSKPSEKAAAFIALARMQSGNLQQLLKNHIHSTLESSDSSSQNEAIHILSNLYKHANTIFIQRYLQQDNINTSLKKIIRHLDPPHDDAINDKPFSVMLSLIDIIGATRNTSLINFLISGSESDHHEIRKHALIALLSVSATLNNQNTLIAHNILSQQSIETLIALLRLPEIKTTSGKALLITTIENKIRNANIVPDQLKSIFLILDNETVAVLITKLMSGELSHQQQRILLSVCSTTQTAVKVVNLKNLPASTKLEEEFLDCVYNPKAIHIPISIPFTLELRKTLSQRLENKTIDIQKRHRLLSNAMVHDAVIANHFFKKHSGNFSEKNMALALNAIEYHNISRQYQALIWKTMKNSGNSDRLRMQAAWLAYKTSPNEVIDFLKKATSFYEQSKFEKRHTK